MEVNNISMMNFRGSNPVNKAADMVADAVQNASRRPQPVVDAVNSTGSYYFMTKNVKGETVKITSLLDAVKALGIKISETPGVITRNPDNFVQTPYGKITCMEDVLKLCKKG